MGPHSSRCILGRNLCERVDRHGDAAERESTTWVAFISINGNEKKKTYCDAGVAAEREFNEDICCLPMAGARGGSVASRSVLHLQ